MTAPTTTPWTPERTALLQQRVREGATFAVIAAELGVSRSAAVAKSNRTSRSQKLSDEQRREIAEAYAAGASSAALAEKYGVTTAYPAMLAQRAGLPPRAAPLEQAAKKQLVRDQGTRMRALQAAGKQFPPALANAAPPPAPVAAAASSPVHFIDRPKGACNYPLWQPPARIGLVCGAPIHPDTPYCLEHAKRCMPGLFQPRQGRRAA